MLFMVIEKYKDKEAVYKRFREKGTGKGSRGTGNRESAEKGGKEKTQSGSPVIADIHKIKRERVKNRSLFPLL